MKELHCLVVTGSAARAKINVDGVERKKVSELLEKHKDCFPEKLPLQFPPDRSVDHKIRHELESTPSRLGHHFFFFASIYFTRMAR